MSNNGRHKLAFIKEASVSQNFMTSKKLLKRIVNLSTIGKEDTVLEIGTGKGHLTRELCKRCGRLYSVEIDRELFNRTASKLSGVKNLRLIHGDFLKRRLPPTGTYKVFANIPYFLTTRIMEKLTEAPNPPGDIWVVMEKGAAKRWMGIPRETGKSLLLKPRWEMRILYYFQKEDFHPKPSVDSVLLHLWRKEKPDVDRRDFIAYKNFVAHSLKYGVWGPKSLLTKKQVSTLPRLAHLPLLQEDGAMLYIQWLCLFRCCHMFHKA